MSSKEKVRAMVGNFIAKFKKMDNSTPELIRRNAWNVSEGMEDWERRFLYGKLLSIHSTKAMRNTYARKLDAEVADVIIDMKEGM